MCNEGMSFSSQSSKLLAESTLQKFLLGIVPVEAVQAGKARSQSKAQAVNNQLKARALSADEVRRLQKKAKLKQQRKLKKQQEEATRVKKVAKHQIIKSHKENKELTVEEEKYLNKIVKRNANSLSRLSEIEDYELKSELESLQDEILAAQRQTNRKTKQKLKKDFNEKLKRGKISYPGLTPGLAPVGLDDDDEDSD